MSSVKTITSWRQSLSLVSTSIKLIETSTGLNLIEVLIKHWADAFFALSCHKPLTHATPGVQHQYAWNPWHLRPMVQSTNLCKNPFLSERGGYTGFCFYWQWLSFVLHDNSVWFLSSQNLTLNWT